MIDQPAEAVVLCVQDRSDLKFAERPDCVGPGLIGRNNRSKGTLGLHMHSTPAVNGDGIPLGVPPIQFEARDGRAGKHKPAELRKTQRWVRELRDTAELAGRLRGTRPVAVMDREADVFELIAARRRLDGIDLPVRARHNRSLGQDRPKLFDRPGAPGATRPAQLGPARHAAAGGERVAPGARPEVVLRRQTVPLPAPAEGPERGSEPIRLNMVHVREDAAPDGAEPLEWFLLTSLPMRSRADAERILTWYRLRWRIEDWHRVLKSGCRAEHLGHRRGERIERAVTIKAAIAWRLTVMTLPGRDTPELPPRDQFSDAELRAPGDFAKARQLPAPDNLGRAALTTAMLGGYLNRKHNPPPGREVLWEGYTRLATATQTYERLIDLDKASNLYRNLPLTKTHGKKAARGRKPAYRRRKQRPSRAVSSLP